MTNTANADGAEQAPPVDPVALAAYLDGLATRGVTATYQEATMALGLMPPQTIHRLALALEASMSEDAAAGRGLRAASVVSRVGAGLPAAGFFAHACALGRYDGPEQGEPARRFHASELARVRSEVVDQD